MEQKIIRGHRVIYERNASEPQEYLRYTLDVYDERENLVEVLVRLADLAVAHAAFEAAVAKEPGKARRLEPWGGHARRACPTWVNRDRWPPRPSRRSAPQVDCSRLAHLKRRCRVNPTSVAELLRMRWIDAGEHRHAGASRHSARTCASISRVAQTRISSDMLGKLNVAPE
jgi:hypothetical protein